MTRIALLLAATALAGPAAAADIVYNEPMAPMAPAPVALAPESNWTGFYIGLQGGGAFNPDDPQSLGLSPNGFGLGTPGVVTAPANSGFPAGSLGAAFGSNFDESFDSGFIGGAHAGYDFQFDRVVVGGIIDINATDISVSQSADSNTPAFYRSERDLEFLATGRVRAGYLITPTVLAYASGGVAYGEIDYSFSTNSPAVNAAFPAVINEDEEEWGYTIGGGMELKITENLSFGAEYLYTDLGGGDSFTRLSGGPFDGSAGVGTGSTDFESGGDFDFHSITAKLSYRFN